MKKTITFLKSLLLAVMLIVGSLSVWGQGTIYSENFGNPGSSTKVNVYTGWSNAISGITYNADTGTDIRTSNASLITDYSGASGAGNVNIAVSGRWFSISGINTEGFTNRVLSFGYRKGAGNGKTNTITAEYSTDGGVSWISINLLNTGTSGWYLYTSSTDFIPAVSNLILKFKSTAANDNRIDDVKIIGTAASTPTITPTFPISLSDFSTTVGTASASQTFTVGGTNLTSDLVITAPTGYEVRENNTETTFGSSVSFTPLSGTVATKTIEVRIAASAAVGTPEGNVVVSSTDATSQNVSVSGTVDAASTPTISLNSSSLSGFSYIVGSGPSAEQSFTVSGTNLTDNISLTAPADYEISTTSGSGFASSLIFTQSEGTVTAQTVYVRLKAGLTVETYNSETITAASNGATDKTVTLSGSVTNPPVPAAPTATAATDVSATGFTANWGDAASATGYDISVYTKSDTSAPELVTNGGFENTLSTDDWGNDATTTNFIVNTTGGHNAAKYLSRTGTSTLKLEQTVATEVGKQYVFSFWYKGYTQSGNGIKNYTIQGSTGSTYIEGGTPVALPSATEWTQYTKTFTATQTSVKISIRSYVAASFDDVSLKAVDNVTTTTDISGFPFTVTETSKVVSGLTPGTAYYYTVVATKGATTSASSNEVTVITDIDGASTTSSLPNCPTCDIKVSSGGTLTVDAAKTYNSITVESGGKLNTTEPLTVGNLVLKAVKDESSFSSIIDATITATSAKLFKTIDDTKWYYMAFPCDVTVVDITKSNGESIGVLGTDWFIKYYDGEQRGNNGTAQTNWKHIEAIPTLTANRGYIFGLKTGTVELSIPLNSSVLAAESTDKNIAVAANKGAAANTNHGWNLIGHPYMSKYNARSNGSAPDYMIMPNPDGKTYTQTSKGAGTLPADLKPFAAYFVQVGAAGNIGFGRNGRQNVPASVAAEVSENIRLNLTTATGADYTYLIMDNDQTTEYQIGEDMVKWLGTGTDVPQVYTLIGDVSYAFNALPMASVVNLPIGLYTKNAGASTISVNALQAPSLSKLLLTDKKENITTDLLVSDYSFNATAGSDNTRFVMSAQRISTGDQINLIDAPSVISSNGKLIINELSPKTNIRIYDATGRLVISKVATERSIEIPLQVVGMYAVHIDAGIKNWTIKIVNNK